MRLSAALFVLPLASGFSPSPVSSGFHQTTTRGSLLPLQVAAEQTQVDLDWNAPRDVQTLEEFAAHYGVQKSDGFQLTSDDGTDIYAMTATDIPAETPILYCPRELVLSSSSVMEELGRLQEVESRLSGAMAADAIPQFYLYVKILKEYELGDQSPWFPYLNSLPRYFANGASMTPFCFDALPPLAGYLASLERTKLYQFAQALDSVDLLSEETKFNEELLKWAFAVVHTRSFASPDGDFRIVPMGDMFNHGTDYEVEMRYDDEGNAYAYTVKDVPAGSPLRMQYGDPTNPSHLLARYGFIDKTSPATFCKIMINNPSQQLLDLGYDHQRMLFYHDTGDVSQEVYDVLLYDRVLKDDPETADAFHQAHVSGDQETKQGIHQHYSEQTQAALQEHVQTFIQDLDATTRAVENVDVSQHPRLPLIMSHNQFVKESFEKVQSRLMEFA